VELVCNHDLEGIEQRVDPTNPREPGVHVADGKHESSVDDDSQHQNTRERHGLGNGFRDGRHGSEDGCHDKCTDVCDQKEYEELARFAAEVSHEVNDQVETHCLRKLQWDVDNDASDCLSRRMIESV